jgi:hypothetical protein
MEHLSDTERKAETRRELVGLSLLVESASLALSQSGIDPTRDRGEDFGRTFILQPAHLTYVGGLEPFRQLPEHFTPVYSPAVSSAASGAWAARRTTASAAALCKPAQRSLVALELREFYLFSANVFA